MLEGRAAHQVQSTLVKAGLSFHGARQILSGQPLSNLEDRKVLASLMIALAESSGTAPEGFSRVGVKMSISRVGVKIDASGYGVKL